MILYLSGPITDRPNHREEFALGEELLTTVGLYEVINPLTVEPINVPEAAHEELWVRFMRGDIAAMMHAGGVATLDGHEKSRGSHLEKRIAFELGIPIMTVQQWLSLA